MTYAANYRDFGSCFRDKASAKSSPDATKPGILRRIFGAIFETRQADRPRGRPLCRPVWWAYHR